jgi:hypothetical protein
MINSIRVTEPEELSRTVKTKDDNNTFMNTTSTTETTENNLNKTEEVNAASKNETKITDEVKNKTKGGNKSKNVTREEKSNKEAKYNDKSNKPNVRKDDNPKIYPQLTVTYVDNTKNSIKNKPFNEVSNKPVMADIEHPVDPVATPEEQPASFGIESKNRKESKEVNFIEAKSSQNTQQTNSQYVTPKIESLGPKEPLYNYETVQYVKQISPAGKAALELQNSGE